MDENDEGVVLGRGLKVEETLEGEKPAGRGSGKCKCHKCHGWQCADRVSKNTTTGVAQAENAMVAHK